MKRDSKEHSDDTIDLIDNRDVREGAKAYLRVYPSMTAPRINTELEARNLLFHSHLKPLCRSTSWEAERNSFGAITFESLQDGILLYFTKLFLSHELWGVDCVILNEDHLRAKLVQQGQAHLFPKKIATGYIEQYSVEALEEYLILAQSHLKLPLPLNVEAGLVDIKGYSLTVSSRQMGGKALRDAVCWSDQILSYEKPAWEILAGFFNRIWDNFGLERPPQLQAALAREFQARRSR